MAWTRWAVAAALAVALGGCAGKVAPGASDYRPLPFLSKVTVTGSDVPGPLRVRDSALFFAAGGTDRAVETGEPVEAVFRAWVNGHGKFAGHWERDGEVVDRVTVFITYGEQLEVRLGDPGAFPTDQPGRHTVRFVVEAPVPKESGSEGPAPVPELTYEVRSPYR
jgi:hypothetical protein